MNQKFIDLDKIKGTVYYFYRSILSPYNNKYFRVLINKGADVNLLNEAGVFGSSLHYAILKVSFQKKFIKQIYYKKVIEQLNYTCVSYQISNLKP